MRISRFLTPIATGSLNAGPPPANPSTAPFTAGGLRARPSPPSSPGRRSGGRRSERSKSYKTPQEESALQRGAHHNVTTRSRVNLITEPIEQLQPASVKLAETVNGKVIVQSVQ